MCCLHRSFPPAVYQKDKPLLLVNWRTQAEDICRITYVQHHMALLSENSKRQTSVSLGLEERNVMCDNAPLPSPCPEIQRARKRVAAVCEAMVRRIG